MLAARSLCRAAGILRCAVGQKGQGAPRMRAAMRAKRGWWALRKSPLDQSRSGDLDAYAKARIIADMRKITPFRNLVITILTLVIIALLPGCFREACNKAMPVLQLGNSYATDALAAIEQAEIYAAGLPLSADARQKIKDAFDAARKGLRAGQTAISAATTACSTPDPLDIFDDLIKAWKDIRSILALASPTMAVSPAKVGGFPFDDPGIYRLAISKGR